MRQAIAVSAGCVDLTAEGAGHELEFGVNVTAKLWVAGTDRVCVGHVPTAEGDIRVVSLGLAALHVGTIAE